jgi:hypothetical protein
MSSQIAISVSIPRLLVFVTFQQPYNLRIDNTYTQKIDKNQVGKTQNYKRHILSYFVLSQHFFVQFYITKWLLYMLKTDIYQVKQHKKCIDYESLICHKNIAVMELRARILTRRTKK